MSNPSWKDECVFYALDRANIGITGEHFSEWERVASFRESAKPVRKGNRIVLKVPRKFVTFYDLEHTHFSHSIGDNRVLLTIDGDIITTAPKRKQ
jgi:hypothetical protein